MTREQLCALALQAIDDADARLVLVDAFIEACPLPKWLLHGRVVLKAVDFWEYGLNTDLHGALERLSYGGDTPSNAARGIAGLLLFGDWPTRWELAERCRRPLWTMAMVRAVMREPYLVDDLMSCPSTIPQRVTVDIDNCHDAWRVTVLRRYLDDAAGWAKVHFAIDARAALACGSREALLDIIANECRSVAREFDRHVSAV